MTVSAAEGRCQKTRQRGVGAASRPVFQGRVSLVMSFPLAFSFASSVLLCSLPSARWSSALPDLSCPVDRCARGRRSASQSVDAAGEGGRGDRRRNNRALGRFAPCQPRRSNGVNAFPIQLLEPFAASGRVTHGGTKGDVGPAMLKPHWSTRRQRVVSLGHRRMMQ
jgi:hypothetical protein